MPVISFAALSYMVYNSRNIFVYWICSIWNISQCKRRIMNAFDFMKQHSIHKGVSGFPRYPRFRMCDYGTDMQNCRRSQVERLHL